MTLEVDVDLLSTRFELFRVWSSSIPLCGEGPSCLCFFHCYCAILLLDLCLRYFGSERDMGEWFGLVLPLLPTGITVMGLYWGKASGVLGLFCWRPVMAEFRDLSEWVAG